MNEEQFKGQWNEIKGKLKERWGRITDDELTQINGRRDQLLGKIQVKYGIAKERAENELNRFLDSFSPNAKNPSAPANSKNTPVKESHYATAGSTSSKGAGPSSNKDKDNRAPKKDDKKSSQR